MRGVVDAGAEPVIASARPVPGNTADATDWRNFGLVAPHRKRPGRALLPGGEDNAERRRARARVGHAFARTKHDKILRDCRRRAVGLHHAVQAVTCLNRPTGEPIRRASAWHLARHPDRPVAPAIRYGYMRTAVSGGYVARGRMASAECRPSKPPGPQPTPSPLHDGLARRAEHPRVPADRHEHDRIRLQEPLPGLRRRTNACGSAPRWSAS
nr:hypothetical protein [Streptomyces hydrogenans]